MSLIPKLFAALALTAAAAQAQLQPLPAADAPAAEIYRQTGSTALVLVVVRAPNGTRPEIHFQSYGTVAPTDPHPPTAESILRLCSLTKIFATDLLVKLAQDKTVRLDDPLERYAAKGRAVPGPATRPITLGDLATHTAGLPREQTPTPAGSAHFTFPSYEQRWAWLPRQRLKTTPGTAALYSNIGFDLLGDALAEAAGKPYPELLAQRTTTPLAMRDTTFYPTPAQCGRLLLGYKSAQHPEGCTPTYESAGSAGLYSTPADIAHWLIYLLGTGEVKQNSAAQAAYLNPADLTSVKGLDHAGTPTSIGLGWMLLNSPETSTPIVEKTGGGAGFTTYIALDQAHHTALFLALTEGNAPWRLNPFRAANDILLGLANLPPMPPEPEKPAPTPRPTARQTRKPIARSTHKPAPKSAHKPAPGKKPAAKKKHP